MLEMHLPGYACAFALSNKADEVLTMAILGANKLYPKPAEGERIEIEPILLLPAVKYWDGTRRIIELGDSHRTDLGERQEIYELFAWNVTYSMPAIIDLPKTCMDNFNDVSQKHKQGGKMFFTRIQKNGYAVPHFIHVMPEVRV